MAKPGGDSRGVLGKEDLLLQIDNAIARIDQLQQKSPKAELADDLLRAARANVAERTEPDDS
jgi:hypothetical protein